MQFRQEQEQVFKRWQMSARNEALAQFQETRGDDKADTAELLFVSAFSCKFFAEKNLSILPNNHNLLLNNVCVVLYFGEAARSRNCA